MTFDYICGLFPELEFEKDVPLSVHSSMKTGGMARIAAFPTDTAVFSGMLMSFEEERIKYSVVGNASNILFSDDGYDDRVIIFTGKMKKWSINDNTVAAECGTSLTSLALNVSKAGLRGLEFAYGIPATVGGAVYMNAGAYGGQISDVVVETKYFDPDKCEVLVLRGDEHDFGYRHSFFHGTNKIILETKMTLEHGDSIEAVKLCEENMQKRKAKQPLSFPSCGSAFKRPEGHFAGALVEQSGLKGFTVGGAQVSEMHAGFVINAGGATTEDVVTLMSKVKEIVHGKFGVYLEPEILILK